MSRLSVTFLLIDYWRQLLMQQRTAANPQGQLIIYPLAWCFPGETVEEGETTLQAAIRGLKEEYGMLFIPAELALVTSYEHVEPLREGCIELLDDVYVVRIGTRSPKLCEGKAMRWMNMRQIRELTLGWQQEKILDAVERWLQENCS